VWVILVILAITGAVTALVATSQSSASAAPEGIPVPSGQPLAPVNTERYPQPIDGIQCQGSEQVAYHIHAHLAIYVDGKVRQVPYGVGMAPPVQTSGSGASTFATGGTCFYWLHTHASDGVIHIESPTQTVYTLGQFFDVWGQQLTTGQVGPETGKVSVFVNGKPYTGDPKAITLGSHDNIQLDVGNPVVPPTKGDVDFSKTQL
jgi:hypothetical protein